MFMIFPDCFKKFKMFSVRRRLLCHDPSYLMIAHHNFTTQSGLVPGNQHPRTTRSLAPGVSVVKVPPLVAS